jgi:outer membrane protein OmpA-like peptidoglycan-associated protein
MNRTIGVVVVVVAAVAGAPACATKSFVRSSVADVNAQVASVSRTVDEHREQTRVMDGRLTEVDRTAQSAQTAAQRAQTSADGAGARADAAARHAATLDAASKRLMYTVVLSEDEGNFPFGKATLPDDARARLDELITRLKADPQGAFFEIEGHTDAIGDKAFNEQLGLDRAEAVKRYLYDAHQIPLHRMNVISYGPDKPVAPNSTRDGRAQNRRVVVRILT